jgi:hypothetical protein
MLINSTPQSTLNSLPNFSRQNTLNMKGLEEKFWEVDTEFTITFASGGQNPFRQMSLVICH